MRPARYVLTLLRLMWRAWAISVLVIPWGDGD
jgi:hypothetical protein